MIIASLIQTVVYFLVALTVSSTVGVASYFVIRLSFNKAEEAFVAFGVLYLSLLAVLSLLTLPLGLEVFVSFLLLWLVTAWVERAANRSQEPWAETFLRLSLTTGLSAIVCVIALACLDNFMSWRSLHHSQLAGLLSGYGMGSLLSPSVIPIVLRIWKITQTRPGIDRHLKEGEKSR